MENTIPKVWGHDIELMNEGVGSFNAKEYCKCDVCSNIRLRRDNIYKASFITRIKRIWKY